MTNKLLRTVKRFRTAKKNFKDQSVTVFVKTNHGRFETGDRKGQVNRVVVRSRVYEIFEGTFYNYQLPLKETEHVMLLNINA